MKTLSYFLRLAFRGWLGLARWLLAFAAELVGPRGCSACDSPLERAAVFCAPCASQVERATDRDRGRAPFVFGGALRDALHRLKYGGRADLAAPLGELLRAYVAGDARFERVDLVVPVPLHPSRLTERTFNQAALLARSVAQQLGAPLDAASIIRASVTKAQASLGREERRENVKDAFVVRRPARIAGRSIVLVDDVVTTGATMQACKDALLRAGARDVVMVALACA